MKTLPTNEDHTPVWLTDVSRRIKHDIRKKRKEDTTTTTHREQLVGTRPQILSSTLPRGIAVRFARYRTGESLEIGILRRRLGLDCSRACRWCCPHVYPESSPLMIDERALLTMRTPHIPRSRRDIEKERKEKGEGHGPRRKRPSAQDTYCKVIVTAVTSQRIGEVCNQRLPCKYHGMPLTPQPPPAPTAAPRPKRGTIDFLFRRKDSTAGPTQPQTTPEPAPIAPLDWREDESLVEFAQRTIGITPMPPPAPPTTDPRPQPVMYKTFRQRLRENPELAAQLPLCPHCQKPNPLAHVRLCPSRLANRPPPPTPENMRSNVDGPDETLHHLFYECRCEEVVKLRKEILEPCGLPLSEMLLTNDLTFIQFMDEALKLLERNKETQSTNLSKDTPEEERSLQQRRSR